MERILSGEYLKKSDLFGFDIDGTIATLGSIVVPIFNSRMGTDYTPEQIKSYNQLKYWALKAGKSEEEATAINRSIWDDPKILIQACLLDGAKELLEFFYGQGSKPPIITTRIGPLRDITLEWFRTVLPFVDDKTIHIGRHTRMEDGLGFKIAKIKQIGIRWFIEDHPETAEAILDNSEAGIILVRHGFNSDYIFPKRYKGRMFWANSEADTPSLQPILDILRM